ncbi:Bug family tripartite tricarboxylate transporter substrate binding protein [Roseococcus pinisoli]|uniref:Tripartite tricarboxylate transporter substrate binding protein n=1 Tax=Roseococcus pinisoli TaxID=2835040 RepID=A0ABS5QJQ8_9PROT|nr:tripartite tricarboxylate transporter substrate-binding protein [Roseococcus pinisoli]MBS7813656.1 tripartite tricarboxylate transporter substrate binding protein [Roseococcus pinisoli]
MAAGRRALLLACGLSGLSAAALAQGTGTTFPTRPISIAVPYTSGSSVDTIARRVAERLSGELGQPVVVENRPGASTTIATTYVARARADGHTLLFGTPALSINPVLQPQLPPGDPRRVLAPVGRIAVTPFAVVAGPSVEASNLEELVAWAKRHPGELTVAITGAATVMRMAVELLARRAEIQVTYVPYNGGSGAVDIIAGRVHVGFIQTPDVGALREERGVRVLAVTSPERVASLPGVRAIGELYPGYGVTSWNGLFAPAGTPEPVLERLNAALRLVLANPELRAGFERVDVALVGGSRADLGDHLDREIRQWAALQEQSPITVD